MEEKNNYTVENEKIIFRRACLNDNMEEIAELIYDTDKYIYPFWFNNDREKAIEFLKNHIPKDGFIFNYNNLYIAYDKTTKHIIGLICALDNSINFDYDYSEIKRVNQNYSFTITNYIEKLIEEVKELNGLYISNVCVNKDYRGKSIGTKLLGYFISQMEEVGFENFALDCLLHNLIAKNLYHSFSFREMKETF